MSPTDPSQTKFSYIRFQWFNISKRNLKDSCPICWYLSRHESFIHI